MAFAECQVHRRPGPGGAPPDRGGPQLRRPGRRGLNPPEALARIWHSESARADIGGTQRDRQQINDDALWPVFQQARGRLSVLRAEGVGFEPTMSVTTHNGFQDRVRDGPDLVRFLHRQAHCRAFAVADPQTRSATGQNERSGGASAGYCHGARVTIAPRTARAS
jgi:hypothetical protein